MSILNPKYRNKNKSGHIRSRPKKYEDYHHEYIIINIMVMFYMYKFITSNNVVTEFLLWNYFILT